MEFTKHITKNGQEIELANLTNDHLMNIIMLFRKKYDYMKENNDIPCFQGDMAQYYADQSYNFIENASIYDIFPQFRFYEYEAISRKLIKP